MQKIEQDNTTVIIRDESVEVNGVLFVKKEVAEPEIHPFLKDVPKKKEMAYTLTSGYVSPIGQVFQSEINRVRDNCDSLIRTAYGWPVTGDSK